MSSWKCKLKQEEDKSLHMYQMSNSGTVTSPKAGEKLEQQKLLFTAGGYTK